MNFKYAVFDMDGTLIDSMKLWREISLGEFERFGNFKASDEDKPELLTHPFSEMAKIVSEKYNVKLDLAMLSDTVNETMSHNYLEAVVKFKPYAVEYLAYLKNNGVKIALATATPKAYVLPFFEKTGAAEYFDEILTTSDDVKASKFKSPEIYDTAVERLGGTKAEAVIFEDVCPAIRTAKNAGYTVYAIEDECVSDCDTTEIKRLADKYITSYKELL